jgi:peptidoglycan/xylan/chitin deacetylase (PgdA/CDA1 family)
MTFIDNFIDNKIREYSILIKKTIVLLYHSVPRNKLTYMDADIFEKQIIFLNNNFHIKPLADYNVNYPGKINIILTFDDGYKNHFAIVAPILKKYQVPATFFVSTRHSEPGKYLWDTHLNLLETRFKKQGFEFRGKLWHLTKETRRVTISNLRKYLLQLEPHPSEMYRILENELPYPDDYLGKEELDDWAAGMTKEQMKELNNEELFEVEAHTTDHPILTKCTLEVHKSQIYFNKIFIEASCNKVCKDFCYPSGEYDSNTVEFIRELGFLRGFAVNPKLYLYPPFEIPRIGIYNFNIGYLLNKIYFSNLLRYIGFKIS